LGRHEDCPVETMGMPDIGDQEVEPRPSFPTIQLSAGQRPNLLSGPGSAGMQSRSLWQTDGPCPLEILLGPCTGRCDGMGSEKTRSRAWKGSGPMDQGSEAYLGGESACEPDASGRDSGNPIYLDSGPQEMVFGLVSGECLPSGVPSGAVASAPMRSGSSG
jgi:hypothetical protein